MKSRTWFYIVAGLLIYILAIAWFAFSTRDQEPAQIFPATVNRDCAPWDGGAFTVSIRYDPITTVAISIWKSPDINFPTTFSFPDETGQVGYVYILPEVDPLQPLSGEVLFWRANQEGPVEGRFDLVTEAGQKFTGQFKAEWGSQMALCG